MCHASRGTYVAHEGKCSKKRATCCVGYHSQKHQLTLVSPSLLLLHADLINATSVHSLSIGVVASYQCRLCSCQTTDSYYGLVNLRSNQHTSTIQAQPRPSNASINATQPPCTQFILSYTHPPPHRLTSP